MSFDLSIEKGDIKIERDGTVKTVSGNAKIKQDIIKILLTDLGDNKFHPQYGCKVGALQIGHYADSTLMSLDMEASARNALQKLMALQKSQSMRQALSPGEIIVDVLSVNVNRDAADPRMYNIFVSVLTQELTEISSNITVRVV